MVDYKQLYNSLNTVSDFISLCENYDEAEIEKNTITWDYNTSAYTYLGNIGITLIMLFLLRSLVLVLKLL